MDESNVTVKIKTTPDKELVTETTQDQPNHEDKKAQQILPIPDYCGKNN